MSWMCVSDQGVNASVTVPVSCDVRAETNIAKEFQLLCLTLNQYLMLLQ